MSTHSDDLLLPKRPERTSEKRDRPPRRPGQTGIVAVYSSVRFGAAERQIGRTQRAVIIERAFHGEAAGGYGFAIGPPLQLLVKALQIADSEERDTVSVGAQTLRSGAAIEVLASHGVVMMRWLRSNGQKCRVTQLEGEELSALRRCVSELLQIEKGDTSHE